MPDVNPIFICPNCEEAITTLGYRQPAVATQYGNVSIDLPITVRRYPNAPPRPVEIDDLDHEYSETSDSDADGDCEYHCPECGEDISVNAINEFLNRHGRIETIQTVTSSPYPSASFAQFITAEGNTLRVGATHRFVETQDVAQTMRPEPNLYTCETCDKTFPASMTDGSCCPSCGAERLLIA